MWPSPGGALTPAPPVTSLPLGVACAGGQESSPLPSCVTSGKCFLLAGGPGKLTPCTRRLL